MKSTEITDYSLTNRERDIMNILWRADKSLIASEVVKERDDLTINTVQAVLKKLLRRNLIKVDQIVYSGTVLCRSYLPALSESEYETKVISTNIGGLKKFKISPSKFVVEFFGGSDEEVTEDDAKKLMDMIRSRRAKQKKGK